MNKIGNSWPRKQVRVYLFATWLLIALAYVFFFLILGAFQEYSDVKVDARNSAWSTIYINLPVLTAFASFWFLPQQGQGNQDDESMIDTHAAFAAFAVTGFVHLIVGGYFFLCLVIDPPSALPAANEEGFAEVAKSGLDMMVFLLSLAVLPVTYITNQKVQSPSTEITDS
ncbi:hypothetical protein SH528x_004267 [Novipirellula sp. SH528]|uniref:hypothetical protein n=1 Tax=Novipirellula sp. SH528 TaxID=3454466 RepID=UPI003FA015E5